jgi:hypothetical protein
MRETMKPMPWKTKPLMMIWRAVVPERCEERFAAWGAMTSRG